jgi:hypothetical protein
MRPLFLLQIDDLKPASVNTSVSVTPATSNASFPASCSAASKALGYGPWTTDLDVCLPALTSISVSISYPDLTSTDGVLVAFEMFTVYTPPSPPPSPPSPPTCFCKLTPDSNDQCPSDQTLAFVSHATDTSIPPYKECIPNPTYDLVDRTLEFGTCFQWSCLPAALYGQPYVISVPNISSTSVKLIPAGTWHVRVREVLHIFI